MRRQGVINKKKLLSPRDRESTRQGIGLSIHLSRHLFAASHSGRPRLDCLRPAFGSEAQARARRELMAEGRPEGSSPKSEPADLGGFRRPITHRRPFWIATGPAARCRPTGPVYNGVLTGQRAVSGLTQRCYRQWGLTTDQAAAYGACSQPGVAVCRSPGLGRLTIARRLVAGVMVTLCLMRPVATLEQCGSWWAVLDEPMIR